MPCSADWCAALIAIVAALLFQGLFGEARHACIIQRLCASSRAIDAVGWDGSYATNTPAYSFYLQSHQLSNLNLGLLPVAKAPTQRALEDML
jgi:hypothetical protein